MFVEFCFVLICRFGVVLVTIGCLVGFAFGFGFVGCL